jgi:hypothetical protein
MPTVNMHRLTKSTTRTKGRNAPLSGGGSFTGAACNSAGNSM